MLENVLHYGLNMVNKKPHDNFDIYFPNIDNENENKKADNQKPNENKNERIVRMKLYNLDNGYFECQYCRAIEIILINIKFK